jgi:hypothetical protein
MNPAIAFFPPEPETLAEVGRKQGKGLSPSNSTTTVIAMKSGLSVLVVVAASLAFSGLMFAAPPDSATANYSADQLARIEDNLLCALKSNCRGAQASAALAILQLKRSAPEYSFHRSIIPLMRIVGSDRYDERARIAASLALHELRSERGDFLIKRSALFSGDCRFKRVCKRLTEARNQERTAERNIAEGTQP